MRLWWWLRERKYWWYDRPMEHALVRFVDILPRELCARAAIRVLAHGTTGRWRNQIVPELTALEALKRWDIPNGR